MTEPATVKSLGPIPRTSPSFLNSIAGEAMAFAKPVTGTSVPAPACFASLSYQPIPVKRALRKTRIIVVHVPAVSSSSSKNNNIRSFMP